jgi:hypothetical protein
VVRRVRLTAAARRRVLSETVVHRVRPTEDQRVLSATAVRRVPYQVLHLVLVRLVPCPVRLTVLSVTEVRPVLVWVPERPARGACFPQPVYLARRQVTVDAATSAA